MGTPSWLEPRVESSREESGEDTVVAASRDVGGTDESRVTDGGSDMPSLSVAVLKAFCNLDDLNALASITTVGLLAGAEDLVARGGSTSSHITGPALNFGGSLGDGRGGCLKLLDEL